MGRIFISFVVGFITIGSILVYQATQGTSSLIFSPRELLTKSGGKTLHRIRVAGRVADPIHYQTEPSIELTFLVADPEDRSATVPVLYRNLKPDMFAADREVLIDGDFEDGRIVAAKLLTQCPSKYEPPAPGGEMTKGANGVPPHGPAGPSGN